jgi:ribonuclease HI
MLGASELLIYTDGACIPNPGRGGWGVVIVHATRGLHKLSGSAQEQTTSSRMEMTAVLMALRKLSPSGDPVVIRIDSEFVVLTLQGQYRQKKNKDLWTEINRERSRLQTRAIRYEWVKGHSDDPYNAMADELANTAAGCSKGHAAKLEDHRLRSPREPAFDDPFRITAPIDPALSKKRPTSWRRKFRRPNE